MKTIVYKGLPILNFSDDVIHLYTSEFLFFLEVLKCFTLFYIDYILYTFTWLLYTNQYMYILVVFTSWSRISNNIYKILKI